MSAVDVVVPCYNYGRYLEYCVSSLLSQEGVDVRVLIIDDCSNDDTELVGQRLAEVDRRVEFRRHEVNQGHIATYNEGLLGWTSARYSLLLSADDALAPGALRRAANLMDRHSEIGMTYGMARVITDNEASPEIAQAVSVDSQIISGSQFLQCCCEIGSNPVPTPTAVVRTDLQHRLGGYRKDFPHTGDLEMWMRFALNGSVGILRAIQGYYRWHGANMASRYYEQMVGDKREFAETCNYVLASRSSQFPESATWLNSMCRVLDQHAFAAAMSAFDRGDLAAVNAWLEFAQIFPKGERSTKWWRLKAKKLLGRALWRRIGPAWSRLLGRDAPLASQAEFFRLGREFGWWPELR